jgi:hypothetical protein
MEITPLLSEDNCLTLMQLFRVWFGPPQIKHCGQVIDGRIRTKVAAEHYHRMAIPVRNAKTRGEAAGLLSICGHFDRAIEYLSEGAKADLSVLISETWLPQQQALALFVAAQKANNVTRKKSYSRQVRLRASRRLAHLEARLQGIAETGPLSNEEALSIIRGE